MGLTEKSIFSAIATIASMAGQFAAGIILARTLGKQGAGEYAYIAWVVATIVSLTQLGLPQVLQRLLAKNNENVIEIRRTNGFSLITFFGVALAVLMIGQWWPYILKGQSGGLIILWGVSVMANNYYSAFMSGRQSYSLMGRYNGLVGALIPVCILVGGLKWGVSGAIAGTIFSMLPLWWVLISEWYNAGKPIFLESPEEFATFGLATWAAAAVSLVAWNRFELYFIERWWGIEGAAIFSCTMSLSMLAIQGPQLFTGALIPHFAENDSRNRRLNQAKQFRIALEVMAFVAIPICFTLAAVSKQAITLVYGSTFAEYPFASMLIVAGASIGAVASIASALVYGVGRSRFIFFSGAIGAVLAAVLFIVLIKPFGVTGAACARVSVQLLMSIVGLIYVDRTICRVPWAAIGRVLVNSTICGISAYSFCRYLETKPGLFLGILIGFVAYIMATRAWKPFSKQDTLILSRQIAKIPNRYRLIGGFARYVLGVV